MSNGFPPGPWSGGGEWSDEGTLALMESPAPGPVGFKAAGFEAGDLSPVAEFGNAGTFVSQFDVPSGTQMVVGDADPA